MAGQRVADGSSLLVDINSGRVIGDGSTLADDRPWRIYYNQYGESRRFPADPVQFQILTEQGWTITKPRSPKAKPKTMKMRDGSIFDFGSAGNDVSQAEKYRMNKVPNGQANTGPTATYYSQNGDVLPNLPADPASMKAYLEMGLSITPPANVAASA